MENYTRPNHASLPYLKQIRLLQKEIRRYVFGKKFPRPWIRMILTEGKNRQVRKMTAKAGFPTLRLIRQRIEGLSLDGMQPGDITPLSQTLVYQKLFYGKNG